MRPIMDAAIAAARRAARFAVPAAARRTRTGAVLAAAIFAVIVPAQAQRTQLPPLRQVVVIGEGSVHVAPDYARIESGVATRAKTAKDAIEANSRLMAGVIAALTGSGIEQKDIQTTRFSLQPVYAVEPHNESKLVGYSVSNHVDVTIRQLDKVGGILDRLVAAGATDIGNVQFLHSDAAKALDQARVAAMADARRKAELYAHASGLALGAVNWISEDAGVNPPTPMFAMRAAAMPNAVPIAAGEDTMGVRITVGFDMTH